MSKEKSRKKNSSRNHEHKAEEPQTSYATEPINKKITVSNLEELKQIDRKHTKKLTPKQRIQYLQKLNVNLYGFDLSHQKAKLEKGEIHIRKET
jgi:hypothetical protein